MQAAVTPALTAIISTMRGQFVQLIVYRQLMVAGRQHLCEITTFAISMTSVMVICARRDDILNRV
jgi:hypothetical protein